MTSLPDWDPPNEHPAEDDVNAISVDVGRLHAHLQDWLETPLTVEVRLDLLRQLREARQSLATAEASAEAACCQAMQSNEVKFNEWVAERKGSWKRNWNHREIAFHLAVNDSGELLPTAEAIDKVLDPAGVSYWRTGSLRAAGVDVDEFSTKEQLRRTVVFRQVTDA